MSYRFRRFGAEPGELLLSTVDPHEAGMRFGRFLAATGLSGTDVVTSTTTVIPLPLYPAAWPADRKRWTGVRAELMWHPLMWLPPRLAGRARLDVEDRIVVESDELWAARVAIEMTASGLYREADGTWLDVLALHDLDIADPAVVARVGAWAAGGDDSVLDGIDLAEQLAPAGAEPEWAFPIAWASVEALRPVARVVHAESLLADTDDIIASAPDLDDAQLAAAVRSLFALAGFSFETLPAELEPDWWRTTLQGWNGERSDLIDRILPEAHRRLVRIREVFWEEAMDTIAVGTIVEADLSDDDTGQEPIEVDDPPDTAELVWGRPGA